MGRWLASADPPGLLYGAIIAATALATASLHDSGATRVAITAGVVLAIYWLADLYVHAISVRFDGDARGLLHRLGTAATHKASVLKGGLPAIVVYVSAHAVGLEDHHVGLHRARLFGRAPDHRGLLRGPPGRHPEEVGRAGGPGCGNLGHRHHGGQVAASLTPQVHPTRVRRDPSHRDTLRRCPNWSRCHGLPTGLRELPTRGWPSMSCSESSGRRWTPVWRWCGLRPSPRYFGLRRGGRRRSSQSDSNPPPCSLTWPGGGPDTEHGSDRERNVSSTSGHRSSPSWSCPAWT